MATDPTSGNLPPYDWTTKRPTQDTDAAAATVLRDASKPREVRR
ncbi:hypothetical protein [Micromonospora rubida]|nr:hypothetical protein [Micromonospora rubida]